MTRVFLFLLFVAFACGCYDSSNKSDIAITEKKHQGIFVPDVKASDFDKLWSKSVQEWVTKPLWSDELSYNSSHVLMVPLHYAFLTNDKNKIRDFELLFDNFNREGGLSGGGLNQVQWMYLT